MAQEIQTPDELKYQFQPVANGVLNFAVRASNDAHIALTSGPEEADPMYEVFIGGWSNSKSVIRKNRTKPDVAEAPTPDILSANEFRRFWVKWQNGTISAGRENDTEPFLTFTDSEFVPIGYYGICTGWGATGTWLIEGDPREIATKDGGEFLTYTFYPVLQGFLEFEVKSPSNAHVALTSGPKETDPMYEILLGGWENTASVIRYKREKPDKVQASTPQLLNPSEFRHFSIQWRNGEILVVHRGGVLLKWTDPSPFAITHFGIRTGWGASGTWRIHKVPIGFTGFGLSAADVPTRGDIGGALNRAGQPGQNLPAGFNVDGLSGQNAPAGFNRDGLSGQNAPAGFNRDGLSGQNVPAGFNRDGLPGQNVPAGFNRDGQTPQIPAGFNLTTPREDQGEEELRETNIEVEEEEEQQQQEADSEDNEAAPQPSAPPAAGSTPAGSGSACWERRTNGDLPEGAVEGGVDIETNEMLYVGRAEHEGALIPGKFVPSHAVTYVSWGGGEHGKAEYEILCGCQATWVKCQDGEIPPGALEGGRSEDGETLYIGRINDGEKLVLGKVQVSHKVCYVPYGGSELAYPEYEVLVAN